MARIRQLDPHEARILGALMEKEQTTPDYYPMTLKAIVSACNQKSNREPVMSLRQQDVADALERLRQDVLVWRSEGARVPRWQHCMDRRWELEGAAKAVMALLLLRGAQTPGELRARGDRMMGDISTQELESTLAALAAGEEPLVRELPRRPGQRENRWIHLVAEISPEQEVAEQALAAAPQGKAGQAEEEVVPSYEERLRRLESEVATLREDLADLRTALGS